MVPRSTSAEPVQHEKVSDSPRELGDLHRQIGDLYNRLEREADVVTRYPFLFSESERARLEEAQTSAMEYGRRFFDVGGRALHSTDAETIGHDYEALVRFGRETLSKFTLFSLRIGDYLEACAVREQLNRYERSHRIHLSPMETESIAEYGRQVAELARDFAAGTMEESEAFRQLAVGGRRLIELCERRLQEKSVPPVMPVPSPGLWSTGTHASIPRDRVDVGAFPLAEEVEALPAEESVISADGPPADGPLPAPPGPPAPTESALQGLSEVELVLEQRRLSLKLNEARLAQKNAQTALDVLVNGRRVRRFVRQLFGKEDQDPKAVFEARKQGVACRTHVLDLTRSLEEVNAQLKTMREAKASSRGTEFALEPQRLQLNGAIAADEAELTTLHRQLGRAASGPEHDGLAERFRDVQRAYLGHLNELARVETELYGQPLNRITSFLRDFDPTVGHGSVTMTGVPTPALRSVAPRSIAPLSPASGGVLLSPQVPEWEEWRARREHLAREFDKSQTLRDAMNSLPPASIPPKIIKAGADRPLHAVPRTISDPGKIVSPATEARNALTSLKPGQLAALRTKNPVTRDILITGANKAREHLRVKPFDFNEYEALDRRRDVLPAEIEKIQDQIAALEAEPTGFLARVKHTLLGRGRLDTLREKLNALEEEERSVHANLNEMDLLLAA